MPAIARDFVAQERHRNPVTEAVEPLAGPVVRRTGGGKARCQALPCQPSLQRRAGVALLGKSLSSHWFKDFFRRIRGGSDRLAAGHPFRDRERTAERNLRYTAVKRPAKRGWAL